MYTTIEADIKNGQVMGKEAVKLPSQAHVLITLLNPVVSARPVFGCAKGEVELSDDFDEPLDDFSDYMS
jgi:hypothetical protein